MVSYLKPPGNSLNIETFTKRYISWILCSWKEIFFYILVFERDEKLHFDVSLNGKELMMTCTDGSGRAEVDGSHVQAKKQMCTESPDRWEEFKFRKCKELS